MEEIMIAAREWAVENHPKQSKQKHNAFADSVTYLVTGWSGGYGGPSIREHLVSWSLAGDGEISSIPTNLGELTLLYPDGRLPRPGEWDYQRAIAFCEPICFGSLSRLALKVVEREFCFDDDPDDLKQVEAWEIEELKELSLKRKKRKLPQKQYLRLKYLKQKYN